MEVVSKLFVYTKLVVVLAATMVAKVLWMGTTRLAEMTRRLVGMSRVDLADGYQQLLSTESVDDVVREDLAAEWVSESQEDNWEPDAKNLLDEGRKPSHRSSESSTEDELIELSDGEEPTSLLGSIKRNRVAAKLPPLNWSVINSE
ncbi:hypothetical protein GN244_ATG06825 [Phytophthora infestans]|uniref:Uncharacterized protein n=1 Tax=Phytophthora infestans TaxID=4787 RepID=A0A833TDN2_PHYIN|nr:hypothetical protein GN244_ATG06825 [Phytophthora infestans]KAF4145154.1 hypothetical protein GN958_ATG05626 [Phytophthora infestans]KAI9993302.1 hypothetical protein PInf_015380 [Phytophthora infestans]